MFITLAKLPLQKAVIPYSLGILEAYPKYDLYLYLSLIVNTFYVYIINLILSIGAVIVLVIADTAPAEPK